MAVITTSRSPDYRDLDLDFVAHPLTGALSILSGPDAVKRSVRNLILTNFYDRPFKSAIGSNATKLLFENASTFTAQALERSVRDVIENFEPRVTLIDITVIVTPDQNAYLLGLRYSINNIIEPITQSIILERIR